MGATANPGENKPFQLDGDSKVFSMAIFIWEDLIFKLD